MKIQPLGTMIQLDIKEAQVGVLDTSSRDSAVEFAEVLATPWNEGNSTNAYSYLNVGDKVFVKAWAVDIITHEDKKYYFVDITSNGVLAKVE